MSRVSDSGVADVGVAGSRVLERSWLISLARGISLPLGLHLDVSCVVYILAVTYD